jgi:hypothetical protein
MPFPQEITNEDERDVFRAFAHCHPLEAAELNFGELLKMAHEMNPQVTEPVLRKMLQELEAKDGH